MRRSGKGSGGGLGMNKVTTPGVRTGAAASGVTPGHAGQIGAALGNHSMQGPANRAAEPMYGAKPISVKLGNEVAGNVGKGGPGAGRTGQASGSQGQHGQATAAVSKPSMPADILSHYGPEIGGRRR